jgi:hypothetical protein
VVEKIVVEQGAAAEVHEAVAEEDVVSNKSNVFCTLEICSHTQGQLPSGLFLPHARRKIDFTDNESPDRVAQRQRWVSAGYRIRPDLERYWWQLSTKVDVVSEDLEDHLIWLLSRLQPNKRLPVELAKNFEYSVSVFWGSSNGTGGGPLITPNLSRLLAEQQINLSIGFYVRSQDD